MRVSSLLFVVFLGGLGTAGCSSSGDDAPASDATVDGAGDAAGDVADTYKPPSEAGVDTAPADAGVDAGCNSTMNVALQVTENDINSNLPTGIGGLIPDGIFVLTAYTRYTGPGGKNGPGTKKIVETIAITGGKAIAGVRQVDTDLGYGYNANIAPTPGGTLAWKQTCPTGEVGVTYGYSIGGADGAETIDIYDTVQKIDMTYTRKFLKP